MKATDLPVGIKMILRKDRYAMRAGTLVKREPLAEMDDSIGVHVIDADADPQLYCNFAFVGPDDVVVTNEAV